MRDHDGNNMDFDDDGNQTSSECLRNKKSRDHDDNDTVSIEKKIKYANRTRD